MNKLDELLNQEKAKQTEQEKSELIRKDEEIQELTARLQSVKEHTIDKIKTKNSEIKELNLINKNLKSDNEILKGKLTNAGKIFKKLTAEKEELSKKVTLLSSNKAHLRKISELETEIGRLAHQDFENQNEIYKIQRSFEVEKTTYESKLKSLHRVDYKLQMMQKHWFWKWFVPAP